ncbi:MAG: Phosphoenolpyruvate synthase/pyruvate phosphate dikinase [Candidatus Magasanikbacteria bacterium GW2011_GWC2_37_14]|uniref:Phosphoenolpyruvate synthase/pyruvate phosphate dikinase n=1 Tax=Candidatus Magasanikbacteria bacterium GW2011_GWC2_37_14 TaxID=1619046 RepID=A0A0G0GCL4_9BACT|nr:MAG: Phosphoenolpyruvate synthase/pyruvate phosphate dikinase [Candidatus Magasanikbacteria bacterium GW2011_GWC2_37_14]
MLEEKIIDEKNNLILKQGVLDLKKYKLAKIVRRDNSPFFNSLMRVGSTIENPELGFDSRMPVHVVLDNDIYYCEDDFKKLEKIILFKAENDSTFYDRYFEKVEKDCAEFLQWSREQKVLSEPLRVYNEYIDWSLKIMSHLWPCLAPEKLILEQIELKLAKYIDPKTKFAEFKNALMLLTSPTEFSEMNLEKKEIFEGKDLKEVYDKYIYIRDQGLYFRYQTFEEYKQELVKIDNPKNQLEKMMNDLEAVRTNQKNLIKELNLDKELLTYCKFARVIPHIRMIRRICVIEAGYNIRELFYELGRKVNLNDVALAYYWEIRDLLEGKIVDKDKIVKRKNSYSFILIGNNFYECGEKEAIELKKKIESEVVLGNEIKGQTACLGKVTGRVKVLHSVKDLGRVERGDILVTSMTMPDYIPAMEKAIAFVTDEGGLSCHAAIVAREMNKPCVIGTKIATKMFKDGDLVEVDAARGIVRKI